jgi:hypothetical protein
MSLQFFPRSYKSFSGWPGQIRSPRSLDGLTAPSSSALAWKLGAICSSKDSGSGSILLSRFRFAFSSLLSPRFGSWALDVKTKTSWRGGWWGRRRAERAGPHMQKIEDRRQKSSLLAIHVAPCSPAPAARLVSRFFFPRSGSR